MPDFLPVVSPSLINLPSQSSFVYWMTKDVEELTNETLSLNRLTDTALQHCNVYPANTVPTIPSVSCPTPVNRTIPPDTTWQSLLNPCEGCILQVRDDGGVEIVEVDSFAYSFIQAVWDNWHVQFSFV
jgi:hypothetical protein